MGCELISMEEFEEAQECYMGWCKNCKEFTRDECEPDANDYECPSCGKNSVCGAEEALLLGLLEFC